MKKVPKSGTRYLQAVVTARLPKDTGLHHLLGGHCGDSGVNTAEVFS